MNNQSWEREEEILLVDLYYELIKITASKEEIVKQIKNLSNLLRKRAAVLGYEVSNTFRNDAGLSMKMANIQYVDTDGKMGSSDVSKSDKDIVNEYKANPERIHSEAVKIREKYEQKPINVDDEPELSIDECPLVTELKKLKKSSSEAVDNDEYFSDFKKYMHVHRSLEDDLIHKIETAKSSNKKSLILVCGNVGDGKSHIISYLKHNYEDLLEGFVIHNDATESKSRQRDEKEELAKVLRNFKDTELENDSDDKVIVAINLGILSNFIDSDQGKEYTRLAEYVNKNRILIDTDISEYADDKGYFYNVNFGDYHIYRLVDGKIDSPYIAETINRIFGDNPDNPFFEKYKACSRCTVKDCPVKHNYEMMQNTVVVNGLINVIVETIVKDKIILSTRDLLDFFYDIMVHPDFEKKDYFKSRNRLDKFIDYSLPSLLFEHDEISILLSHIKKYDFISQRTEKFDEIITQFNTTDNIADIFKKYVYDNPIMNFILSININEECKISKNSKNLRESLLYCFARLCKLAPKGSDFSVVNNEFNDFISDLFYSIQKNKIHLKKLYMTVEKCVYEWNGGSYSNRRINLKNDIEGYIVSAELDLDPDLSCYTQVSEDNSFEKFPSYINLTIMKKKNPECKATISIDYDLYKMLKLVEKGYRPSAKDNNRFISFTSFVNKLSEYSSYDEEVTIQCLGKDEYKEYNLSKGGFGYSFSEVR